MIAEPDTNLIQSQADVQSARLNLDYTEIRSPIDGYVGNRAAETGAYVTAGAYLLSVIPSFEKCNGLWRVRQNVTRLASRSWRRAFWATLPDARSGPPATNWPLYL